MSNTRYPHHLFYMIRYLFTVGFGFHPYSPIKKQGHFLVGNWSFSPGHTLSHKTVNVLLTAAGMTKMKAHMYRKLVELLVKTISQAKKAGCFSLQYLVNWLKRGFGVITFPNPYPKILLFFTVCGYVIYDFAHDIANIWDIPAIFVSCRLFGVIYDIQMLFDVNTVLSYLPMDQPLKICVKEMWQKMRQSYLYWWLKSDIAAFLELNPGISMTHRYPANWKIGSPFVPPDETTFHCGPRTKCGTHGQHIDIKWTWMDGWCIHFRNISSECQLQRWYMPRWYIGQNLNVINKVNEQVWSLD